jgi:2'-5' RNA ligase
MTDHQKGQLEVINQIEEQVRNNSLKFTTVTPVENYGRDTRLCLTSVHFPSESLIDKIKKTLIIPLQEISPRHFYYSAKSLHITIKNIRVVNDPPNFTDRDIEKVAQVFSTVILKHSSFKVYFYRLLLFPNNLSLIGKTDPELDNIILDLDRELKSAGIPDDKKYLNTKYFFANITLARFSEPLSEEFKQKVKILSDKISFPPYAVDSIALIKSTATLGQLNIAKTWELK